MANDPLSQILGPAGAPGGLSGYGSMREVRARASAIPQSETEAERRAVDRLGHLLATGEPLDSEVPRGYYLNIRV